MTDAATDNRTFWLNEERRLDKLVEKAVWPGGQAAVDRLAKQGEQPVRQLIEKLVDQDTVFYELSRIAGFGMGYPGVEDVPCSVKVRVRVHRPKASCLPDPPGMAARVGKDERHLRVSLQVGLEQRRE